MSVDKLGKRKLRYVLGKGIEEYDIHPSTIENWINTDQLAKEGDNVFYSDESGLNRWITYDPTSGKFYYSATNILNDNINPYLWNELNLKDYDNNLLFQKWAAKQKTKYAKKEGLKTEETSAELKSPEDLEPPTTKKKDLPTPSWKDNFLAGKTTFGGLTYQLALDRQKEMAAAGFTGFGAQDGYWGNSSKAEWEKYQAALKAKEDATTAATTSNTDSNNPADKTTEETSTVPPVDNTILPVSNKSVAPANTSTSSTESNAAELVTAGNNWYDNNYTRGTQQYKDYNTNIVNRSNAESKADYRFNKRMNKANYYEAMGDTEKAKALKAKAKYKKESSYLKAKRKFDRTALGISNQPVASTDFSTQTKATVAGKQGLKFNYVNYFK